MKPAGTSLIGFKRHLRAETVPAEAVYLIAEQGVTALSGPLAERIAPLLDGTRSLAQLERELSPELTPGDVWHAVNQLSVAGLLEFRGKAAACAPAAMDEAAAAFWSLAGLDADSAASAMTAVRVQIVAADDDTAATVAAACAESGLACQSQPAGCGLAIHPGTILSDGAVLAGTGADITLVLCDDYLDDRLRAINEWHLSHGRPWLLAKPSGAESWVGPLFRPGAGPCWACLADRLERNRDATHLLRRVLGDHAYPAAPRTGLPATRAIAIGLAVLEITKWAAGIRALQQQVISALDAVTLRGRQHPVSRRPQCGCCGDPGMVAARASRPPALCLGEDGARAASGIAGAPMSPDQVLSAYGHLVDPVTGLVGELRPEERCPPFQHAFLAGRNRAVVPRTMAGLRAAARFQSGGKGVTEAEARAGALCEAVERYCGTRHGDEAVIRSSYRDLGGRAVHPSACMLFDERQIASRAAWNATCAPFHWIPAAFDDSMVIEWTPVWSLVTGEQRLLPTALLYYSPGPHSARSMVLADSNGSAAGSTLDHAVISGFLELVERDAVALWWYNRTRHPEVSLAASGDPWIMRLPADYERLGREVWALDITSDLGIPVVAAVSRCVGQPAEDVLLGFGASPDWRVALRRALLEVGQLLAAAPAGDGENQSADPHLADWRARVTVESQPCLLPGPAGQPARQPAGQSLDVEGIRVIARAKGLDVLVVDQTRPDIGMPVAKVVVPGLRHFWPRFAPGRLFDIPVSLGRLPRPTRYADLNPIPLYV
jgi:ribosomal protein S12 methylthiotransferase accessory factor